MPNTIKEEGGERRKCGFMNHFVVWAGDGYFCSYCGVQFTTCSAVPKERKCDTCDSSQKYGSFCNHINRDAVPSQVDTCFCGKKLVDGSLAQGTHKIECFPPDARQGTQSVETPQVESIRKVQAFKDGKEIWIETPQPEWEREFVNTFQNSSWWEDAENNKHSSAHSIKSFIRQLLTAERAKIRERVKAMTFEHEFNSHQVVELDDVLAILDEKESK